MTTRLTPNFTLEEFTQASMGGNVPWQYRDNLAASADLMQAVRDLVGLPVRITSFWRSPGREAALGHNYKSQHLTASATDCKVVGMDSVEAAQKIVAAHKAGAFPDWGQLIVYPHTSKHLHISLPNRVNGRKNDVLCEVWHNTYVKVDITKPLPPFRKPDAPVARPLVAQADDRVTSTESAATPAPPETPSED